MIPPHTVHSAQFLRLKPSQRTDADLCGGGALFFAFFPPPEVLPVQTNVEKMQDVAVKFGGINLSIGEKVFAIHTMISGKKPTNLLETMSS